jgi:uncharacterized CHY-type Zn-finger protein
MTANRPEVRGIEVDAQTRCAHYHKAVDIIAIKMKCCGIYYACKDCHAALADHEPGVWPRAEWNRNAILCGACSSELTIGSYMECKFRCPVCNSEFNPGCKNHYGDYFEILNSGPKV